MSAQAQKSRNDLRKLQVRPSWPVSRAARCPRTCHDDEVTDAATRLGVPSDASAATVRAAFARQVRAVHPDSAGPGLADPGAELAALIAARDHLLARSQSVPHPQTGPVVFVRHRDVVGSLRALVYHRKRPRRQLC